MLRIKEMRLWEGLTQKQLAEKIGLTAHNVGDWERGKAEPSVADLIKLADVFDCSVDVLVGRDTDEQGYEPKRLKKEEIALIKLFRELPEKAQEYIMSSADTLRKW